MIKLVLMILIAITLNDIYEWSYVSLLDIKLPAGMYNLRAEIFQSRITEKQFTKTSAAQNVDITF